MGKEIIFGWKKDDFDSKAKYHIPKIVRVPDIKDLSGYIPKIGSQDGVGECVGFGFAGGTSTVAAQLGYISPKQSLYHSANYIYNGARKKMGTLDQDSGAYPDLAADWIVENSLVSWVDWPFEDRLDTTDPDVYKIKAIQYTQRTKVRVDNGVEGIISAIAEGHPVMIGIPWASSWMSYSSGVLPMINGSSILAGGHEIFLWKYDKVRNTVFGSNSWDTDWGIDIPALGTRGGFEMPMDVFEVFKNSFGGYDAHYITFEKPIIPVKDITSISLEPNTASVVVGNTVQLKSTANYTDGTSENITTKASWINENGNIATVNSSGLVKGEAVGKTNVISLMGNVQSNSSIIDVTPKSSNCKWGKAGSKILNLPLALTGRDGRYYYMKPK